MKSIDLLDYNLHFLDHAWFGASRRGSSQSETQEIETYQLGKDFSKSLPGSRRSSFQDQEKKSGDITPVNLNLINIRRSSCVLKAVRGELGRTMSLNRDETEYNRPTRRNDNNTPKLSRSLSNFYLQVPVEFTETRSQISTKVSMQVSMMPIGVDREIFR